MGNGVKDRVQQRQAGRVAVEVEQAPRKNMGQADGQFQDGRIKKQGRAVQDAAVITGTLLTHFAHAIALFDSDITIHS